MKYELPIFQHLIHLLLNLVDFIYHKIIKKYPMSNYINHFVD